MNRLSRILLPAAAVVGGAAAITIAGTGLMVSTAMDREPPAVYGLLTKNLFGPPKPTPYLEKKTQAAEALEKAASETVTVTARDGCLLTGHLLPADDPKRIIIAFHGWRTPWNREFGLIADFWKRSGCTVLYAEQRGQGRGPGNTIGFGLTERFDCSDWASWASGRFGTGIPVYLAGVSLGAATVLMAAGIPLPDCVRGILADCGYTSPDAIWQHIIRDGLHLPAGLPAKFADMLCRKKTGYGSSEVCTAEILAKTEIPVFLIHGTADTFVPTAMTEENYAACASKKRLLLVPGAAHAMSYYTDPAEYEQALTEFWQDVESTDCPSETMV